MKIFTLHIIVIVVFIRLDLARTQRRIVNGQKVENDKRFMAYLVKAPLSPQQYDAWICGGAIVTSLFIVTSAACVEDIQYMYAIAGYNKYVSSFKINEDNCTKSAKKKVVFTCTPKNYELEYDKTEKWSSIDIAVVRVETPYDFDAPGPVPGCTWRPNMIEINYEPKYQEPGTDSLVLGWGHKEKWRKIEDNHDYNQETLQFGPTLIQDKATCRKSYEKTPELIPIIDSYMICTFETGNIDANGLLIKKNPPTNDGCSQASVENNTQCKPEKRFQYANSDQYSSIYGNYDYWRRRYDDNNSNSTTTRKPYPFTRRTGICQNDHGGPLVTWVGTTEVLIGVASVFLVSGTDMRCVGPYLYTSTQCNGAFLGCVLTIFSNDTSDHSKSPGTLRSDDEMRRQDIYWRYQQRYIYNRRMCDLPPKERGFDMVHRRISWLNHPDGPAINELSEDLIERPQIPLNAYGSGNGR